MNEFKLLHADLYGQALAVAKKFTSQVPVRPILNYVYHKSDGRMVATDTHKAVIINDIHGFDKDILINPYNQMAAIGKYPDVIGTLAKYENVKTIKLNKQQIKVWLQTMRSANQIFRATKAEDRFIRFKFENNSFSMELVGEGLEMILPCVEYEYPGFEKILFDVEILRDCLEVHQKMNEEEVTIFTKMAMQPIKIIGEKTETTALPIRTY